MESQQNELGSESSKKEDHGKLLETVDCSFCSSNRHSKFTGEMPDYESRFPEGDPLRNIKFQFVKCDECETVYLRDRPAKNVISRFYSEAYHCFETFEKRGPVIKFLAQLVLRQKIKLFEKHFPPGNKVLLDYGCGSGVITVINCPTLSTTHKIEIDS